MGRIRTTSILMGSALLLGTVLVAPAGSAAAQGRDREVERVATATGTGGAAASLDPRASEAAIQILDQGGNAIDAAVAASAMLGLVRPYDGSIGGDGYMAIHLADEDRTVTVDMRGTAPAGLDEPAFRALPAREARAQSVAVPGLVRGWETALERFGTMPLRRVLQPAIREASRGFVVDEEYHNRTQSNRERFLDYRASREYYLTDTLQVPEVGDVVRNPDLAETYRLLGRDGADAFYEGEIAEAIVGALTDPPVAADRDVVVAPSTVEAADLAQFRALVREPVTSSYRGYELVGNGGSSTGGPTVAEILNILAGFELSDREEARHAYIEASRLAFADRAAYIGTAPDWEGAVPVSDAPYPGVMSQAFADERRSHIGSTAAPGDVPPGDVFAYDDAARAVDPADLSDYPGADPGKTSTTHLSVSDADGNIVSFTFTIVSIGGSGIAVPGHGFLLNNGLIGSIPPPEPGERGGRPYSNTAPTILFRDGEPVLTVGSPGSADIIATVAQILGNHIDFGMPLAEALAEPRLANNTPSATTTVETALLESRPELVAALRARGHLIEETGSIGNATGIQFLPDGRVQAVAEPERSGGGAAAVQHPER